MQHLAAELTSKNLTDILRGAGLAVSGAKQEQARRLALATNITASGVAATRPTRGQIVYVAAVSRRQDRIIPLQAATTKAGAQSWLSEFGDYN